MDNKILKFNEDEFKRICYEDHEDFKLIEEIQGESDRWSREITIIVEHLETGIKYMGSYQKASTEMQEDEFYDTDLTKCKQIEVKTLKWVEDIDL